jgi:hypothetical protein
VLAIDANGKTFTTTSNALGAYTVNVAGGTAPFLLTVTGISGGIAVTLNSVATAIGQTVNITPLTDLIVSTAAGQPSGQTLATLCTSTAAADQLQCKAALTTVTTGTNLSAAVTAVTNMIAPLNSSGTNPLNGAFVAGSGSGMDAVLDAILVTPAAAQGAMATVTLISVPGANLGTVTLPATAGGTATPATVTTTTANITAAADGAAALAEIKACLASFSALYPANMTAAPTSAQVTPFIDATFRLGGPTSAETQSKIIGVLTDLASNGNGGAAQPGLSITASALSKFSFAPQTDPATALPTFLFSDFPALSTTGSTTTAWVKISAPLLGGELANWKMVKNAAYPGCAGGWKMAGSGHIDMHMNARITKNSFTSTVTYTRSLPFHVETAVAEAEGIKSIVVKGPGLSTYNAGAPATLTNFIVMIAPPAVTAPAVRLTAFVMQNQLTGFYGAADSIQSCQDLAAIAAPATLPPTGTPCYDETAVAPGATFRWVLNDAAQKVLYVFPYQIAAVPLSKAFAIANDKDLFAQNITAVPAGVAALNTAAAGLATGALMDNLITFSYTQSSVYGARTDSCGIGVSDASNVIVLRAEQDATGQQTSCTFKTAGLNSGSLAKPSAAFGGTNSFISVGNHVLGNQAGSSLAYK